MLAVFSNGTLQFCLAEWDSCLFNIYFWCLNNAINSNLDIVKIRHILQCNRSLYSTQALDWSPVELIVVEVELRLDCWEWREIQVLQCLVVLQEVVRYRLDSCSCQTHLRSDGTSLLLTISVCIFLLSLKSVCSQTVVECTGDSCSCIADIQTSCAWLTELVKNVLCNILQSCCIRRCPSLSCFQVFLVEVDLDSIQVAVASTAYTILQYAVRLNYRSCEWSLFTLAVNNLQGATCEVNIRWVKSCVDNTCVLARSLVNQNLVSLCYLLLT